ALRAPGTLGAEVSAPATGTAQKPAPAPAPGPAPTAAQIAAERFDARQAPAGRQAYGRLKFAAMRAAGWPQGPRFVKMLNELITKDMGGDPKELLAFTVCITSGSIDDENTRAVFLLRTEAGATDKWFQFMVDEFQKDPEHTKVTYGSHDIYCGEIM